MMFVKLYFPTSDIYLISLISLDQSGFHLWDAFKQDQYATCTTLAIVNISATLNNISTAGSVDVWCSARWSCRVRGFESH